VAEQRFEDEHRALRAVTDEDNINPDLWSFDDRTGPLIDALAAAARALRDAPRDGSGNVDTLHRVLYQALDALDREAARG
jgi:hypothetical protein